MLIGIAAGVIDLIPMIIQKLTWDANLSAFSFWVVTGFMVATSGLRINPVLKGVLLAVLCLLPTLFLIGWQNPLSLMPILVMTLILGALVGFAFNKIVKE